MRKGWFHKKVKVKAISKAFEIVLWQNAGILKENVILTRNL